MSRPDQFAYSIEQFPRKMATVVQLSRCCGRVTPLGYNFLSGAVINHTYRTLGKGTILQGRSETAPRRDV